MPVKDKIILSINDFSKKFMYGEIVFESIGVVVVNNVRYRVFSCDEFGNKVVAHEDIDAKCLLELM